MRAALLLPLLTGCLSMLPAGARPVKPMTALHSQLPEGGAKCLVVLLPGVRDDAADFTKHGFVQAVRNRGLSVDLIAANATFGYYLKGVVVERLAADVISPARARGYSQTWLMGVSLGALGAFLYSEGHPGEIAGVIALAPYLGERPIIQEIGAAGGLAAWPAPERATELSAENYERQLWRWLKAVTEGREPGPPIYLGWGTDDLMGEGISLLADALPKDRLVTVQGGHKWTSWKKVLDVFLADSDFTRSCGTEALGPLEQRGEEGFTSRSRGTP